MTAHTRTTSLSPSISPAFTLRWSTRRIVLIAASFVLEAVIVLGFVSSSVGLGAAPYPDPDHGWSSPAPSIAPNTVPADAATVPASSDAFVPEPAPAPAP